MVKKSSPAFWCLFRFHALRPFERKVAFPHTPSAKSILPAILAMFALLFFASGARAGSVVLGPATTGDVTVFGEAPVSCGYELPDCFALVVSASGSALGGTWSLSNLGQLEYFSPYASCCTPFAPPGTLFAGEWVGVPNWYFTAPGYSLSPFQEGIGLISQPIPGGSTSLIFILGPGENLVMNLASDPVNLYTLTNNQTGQFQITGGCITSGTSCGGGPSPTPEPSSLLLLGSGLLGLALFLRRFSN